MKIFKLYISVLTITLVGCSDTTLSKPVDNVDPNETKVERKTSTYPDCFSDIDTNTVEQGLGCGSIFLYKKTDKGIITISIDPEKIELSTQCQEYQLKDGIKINLEIYPTQNPPKDSLRSIDFCGCTKITNAQKRIAIKAESGHLTAVISPSRNSVLNAERITVRLNNLKFTSPLNGESIEFEDILIWNANVGWFAG